MGCECVLRASFPPFYMWFGERVVVHPDFGASFPNLAARSPFPKPNTLTDLGIGALLPLL
jgi:hypothetical protein